MKTQKLCHTDALMATNALPAAMGLGGAVEGQPRPIARSKRRKNRKVERQNRKRGRHGKN